MAKRQIEKLVNNGESKTLPAKVPSGKAPVDTMAWARQDVQLCAAVESAAGLRNKLLASVAADALKLSSPETRKAFVNQFTRNLQQAWVEALADGMKIEGKDREAVGLAIAALNAGTKQWQTLLPGAKGATEIRDGRSYAILSGLAAAFRSTPTTYISQARSYINDAIEGGLPAVKRLEAATTAREAALAVSSKAGTLAVRNKAGDPAPAAANNTGAQEGNDNSSKAPIHEQFAELQKGITNPEDAMLILGNLLYHIAGKVKMEGPDAKFMLGVITDYKRHATAMSRELGVLAQMKAA